MKEEKTQEFKHVVEIESLQIQERKTKIPYNEIKDALEAGKAWVFNTKESNARNTMHKVEQRYNIKCCFVRLKDGNFAIFKSKTQ